MPNFKNNNKHIKHKSAGGIVLYGKKELFTPLLKKKSGEWVIPKGHIKKGETAINAALREIKEELGLKKINKIKKIAQIDTINYSFKKNNIKNSKEVNLFTFYSFMNYKLNPLKKEGFVDAKWMNINDALRLSTYKSERMAIENSVNIFNYYTLKNCLIDSFKKGLGNNLVAIILTGSLPNKYFKEGWSDVDILIIVNKLDILTKQKIAQIKKNLEKRWGKHFGINIINKLNAVKPIMPSISLDGKTLQTLLETKKFPQNIVYNKNNLKLYYPQKKDIKDYSLSNIGILLLRNRKNLSGKIPTDIKEYKDITSKEMRAANIMTKLAIQYFSGYTCENHKDLLIKADRVMNDFDFDTLKMINKKIDDWDNLTTKDLKDILKKTNNYIENFSFYVFKKASKIKNKKDFFNLYL